MKENNIKKATLKDIAREANVSVATVSYILNNVSNQSISDDTRCRVLETAKRLNYVPNLSARSLVKGKSGLIGLLINTNLDDGIWKQLYYGMLSKRLEIACQQYGYHLIINSVNSDTPNIDITLERELDGVFLVDVKNETFNNISKHFKEGVPIVVLDSVVDDPLFYKVLLNYKDAFSKIWSTSDHNRFLVLEKFNNQTVQQAIIDAANVLEEQVFILTTQNSDQLIHFLKRQEGKKGVIINEFIAIIVANLIRNAFSLDYSVICSSHSPELLPSTIHCLYADDEHQHTKLAADLMYYLLTQDETLKHKLFHDHVQQQYVYSDHNLQRK